MADYMRDRMNEKVSRSSQQTGIRQMQRQAAGRESRLPDLPVWLQIDAVTVDLGIQVRVAGLDEETLDRYVADMERDGWGSFPPIIVFREGETFTLGAGFHRLEAARRAGLTEVLAESRPGGRSEAYWFAVTDNALHGLLLSRDDKKEALKRLIGLGDEPLPEGQAVPSNRDLAAQLHISHPTVAAWIAELQKTTGKNLPVERVGKDGRMYDPSNIQDANQRRYPTVEEAKATMLAALANGPLSGPRLVSATPNVTEQVYKAAYAQLIEERQIVEFADNGVTYYRLNDAPFESGGGTLPDREALAQKLLREVRNLPGGHRVGLQSRVIGSFPTAPEREQYKAVYAYLLAAGQIHEDVAFGVQLGPDPSASPAAPALPQGVTLAPLGADAHSSDHNADLDYAVRLRVQLEHAALHAIDALAAVRQVRSIQSLYLVGDEALAATDGLLDRFEQSMQVTFEHVEQLRERVQTMRETGAPYEDS